MNVTGNFQTSSKTDYSIASLTEICCVVVYYYFHLIAFLLPAECWAVLSVNDCRFLCRYLKWTRPVSAMADMFWRSCKRRLSLIRSREHRRRQLLLMLLRRCHLSHRLRKYSTPVGNLIQVVYANGGYAQVHFNVQFGPAPSVLPIIISVCWFVILYFFCPFSHLVLTALDTKIFLKQDMLF